MMPSKVFFLPASEKEGHEVLAEKTKRIFGALKLTDSINKDSFVGIKIHFGEKGNTGFVKPLWLKHLIDVLKKRKAKIFLTDTNTLYLGNRSNSVEHLQLAAQHGFSLEALGVPVILADGLIGKEFGDRDHSTVLNAMNNIEKMMEEEEEMKELVEDMIHEIKV